MSEIALQEKTVTCDACGSVYHFDCWEEHRGCCAKECPKARRIIEINFDTPPARSRLLLTREAVESASNRKAMSVSNPCVHCGKQVPPGELYCNTCRPTSILEHQDAKNVGPILIMLLVSAVLLAWLIVAAVPTGSLDTIDQLPKAFDRVER